MDTVALESKKSGIMPQLMEMLEDTLGRDVVKIMHVGESSAFLGDLQMDSIAIVALAEKVNAAYGEKADLARWLSRQPARKLLKLTVGDVADYIAGAIDC
jgi:acyl carrier protein